MGVGSREDTVKIQKTFTQRTVSVSVTVVVMYVKMADVRTQNFNPFLNRHRTVTCGKGMTHIKA